MNTSTGVRAAPCVLLSPHLGIREAVALGDQALLRLGMQYLAFRCWCVS